ncbi:MAG: CHASE2 domain-containing protein, partial [Ghiorsea sp.]|nr:CHASE2 domain-containing protein [Ghiorsea sp.]
MLQAITKFIEQYAKWLGMPLVILMACIALALTITKPNALEQFEMKSLDFRFQARGPIPADPRVAIIAVDDNALAEVGRWPWPRDVIAQVVDKAVGKYGAKALGFDIVFSEAQVNKVDEAVRILRKAVASDPYTKVNLAWLQQHRKWGDVDAELESVIQKYKNKLVPGYFFYPQGADVPELVLAQMPAEKELMQSLAMTSQFTKESMLGMPHIEAIEGNLPRITEAADAIGFFNFFPDSDGTVRRIPLMAELDGFVYHSMAMQTLRMYLDWPDMAVVVGEVGVEEVHL